MNEGMNEEIWKLQKREWLCWCCSYCSWSWVVFFLQPKLQERLIINLLINYSCLQYGHCVLQ